MDNPETQEQPQPQRDLQVHAQPPLHGDLKNLYDSLKPFVWRLHVQVVNHPNMDATLTAFSVGNGLLMTCGHGGWTNWKNLKITAKPFSRNNTFEGHVVDKRLNCDMALVALHGVDRMPVAKLASGKLDVGETIMVFGHPFDFFASGLVGHNIYPCVDNTRFDFNSEALTCENFIVLPLQSAPRYRIMGHVWNKGDFDRYRDDPNDKQKFSFEKKLIARLPIIQAAGMVCGAGSSGAPVFNLKREVVGMHVYGIKGYEIGIHIAGLNAFLQNYITSCSGGSGGAIKVDPTIKAKGKAPLNKRRR